MHTEDQQHGAALADEGIIITSGTRWQGIAAEVRRYPRHLSPSSTTIGTSSPSISAAPTVSCSTATA
jgi:hypothetical protein